jgi:hypothetical protein
MVPDARGCRSKKRSEKASVYAGGVSQEKPQEILWETSHGPAGHRTPLSVGALPEAARVAPPTSGLCLRLYAIDALQVRLSLSGFHFFGSIQLIANTGPEQTEASESSNKHYSHVWKERIQTSMPGEGYLCKQSARVALRHSVITLR